MGALVLVKKLMCITRQPPLVKIELLRFVSEKAVLDPHWLHCRMCSFRNIYEFYSDQYGNAQQKLCPSYSKPHGHTNEYKWPNTLNCDEINIIFIISSTTFKGGPEKVLTTSLCLKSYVSYTTLIQQSICPLSVLSCEIYWLSLKTYTF